MDFSDVAFHDKLEARLWQLGKQLLRLGQPVIFERGLWQRSERDEMRRGNYSAGFGAVPLEGEGRR